MVYQLPKAIYMPDEYPIRRCEREGAREFVLAFVLVIDQPISPDFTILRGTGLLDPKKEKRSFS